jgi:hypothetical protein
MPTIEELFKNKKLVSGQTAEQQYDIRNTADLQRNPYNVLMTPSFRIAEIGRRNATNTTRETKLEEELSGLRILANTSSPFLYGTDIIKFSKKSRGIVEDMKGGAGGVASAGILDTFLNKAETAGKNLLSKIGVKLPEQLIPSRIVLNKDFGTIGPLGPGAKPGSEFATMVRLQKIKSESGGNFLGKLLANNLQGRPNENQLIGSAIDVGKKALNKLLLGSPSEAAQNKAKLGDTGNTTGYASDSPYSKVVMPNKDEGQIGARIDLSTKYNSVFPQKELVGDNPYKLVRPNVIKTKKSRFSNSNPAKISDSIEVKRGMYTTLDYLNKMVAYPSNDGLTNSDPKGVQVDGYDFVTLKFWSVSKLAAINFRATINGLTETLTPSWDPNRFIGNPFSFYTYNSIERGLSFNFKVYSLSYDEHKSAWQRLNFLTSLVYPQNYSNVSVTPPFIKFTLGDMFVNKEAFIESLTYTIDDTTPWDIGIDEETKNWKLPKIISVDVTLKLVENKFSTFGKRLYGYGGVATNIDIEEDKNKELNRDGSPKKREEGKKQDVKPDVKKDGTPAANPTQEKPKPPEDPKGELVGQHKGYELRKTKKGPMKSITSWKGDAKLHAGDLSSADDSILIDIEKGYIDSKIDDQRRSNQDQAQKEGLTAAEFFAKYPDRKTGQENG